MTQPKPGAKRGRPRKLDDEQTRLTVLRVLRAGGSRADAATKAGVTIYTIKAEARRNPVFSQGLLEAELDGKLSLVVSVREAAKRDWKAAAWMLERKYYREFARRTPDNVSPAEFIRAVRQLADYLSDLVPNEKRQLLIDRVENLATEIDVLKGGLS